MEKEKELHKKPKVLLVGPGLDVKGGITTVLNSYFDSDLAKKVDFDFVPTMEDGSKLKKLIVAIEGYLLFCKKIKICDIVHIHMAAQASFTRKSFFVKKAYKENKKIIIHQHAGSFDDFFLKQSSKKKQDEIKYIFSLANDVVVLSEHWQQFFCEKEICYPEKIHVIYNGVKPQKQKEKDYSNTNVMFLGRLDENKGIYDLLKAIPSVIEKIPSANFYFAGDGELEKAKKLSEELKIQQSVHFVGWLDKAEKEILFKKCSVFVLPTYFEAMPMSVLEAMSFGLATITTAVGGIPQIIKDQEDGVFVTPGDVGALSNLIEALLLDIKQKRFLGENAIKKTETKFSLDSILGKLHEIYMELYLRS